MWPNINNLLCFNKTPLIITTLQFYYYTNNLLKRYLKNPNVFNHNKTKRENNYLKEKKV